MITHFENRIIPILIWSGLDIITNHDGKRPEYEPGQTINNYNFSSMTCKAFA
ncbi:hypothetical protein [Methanospirillum lacunae]|uniref:hypothetical protein n=1 Tax=Methanospirillum lacunae TaxID=668570 RepID=UPI0038FC5AEE